MQLTITLVAERVNGAASNHHVWQRIYADPARYWQLMTDREAFRWHPAWAHVEERCWERLRSVLGDVELDHTMQLLRPHHRSGAWSLEEARVAAASLVLGCPKPSLLICCGSRVTKAVYHAMTKLVSTDPRYPLTPGAITGDGESVWFTRIPHPSGRNTQYTNAELIAEIRERFTINLELLKHEVERATRAAPISA